MNFAFCLFKYKPLGGLELDFSRILEACLQHGHQVTVYTMAWRGAIPAGVEVNVIPVLGVTNHGRCAAFARKLQRVLASKSYDLVVGFNKMPGLDVCYAADVCYKQRVKVWARLSRRYRYYTKLEQAVFAPTATTHILYLAESIKQQYIACYGTPVQRFHQLAPGLPVAWRPTGATEQQRLTARADYKLEPHDKLLLLIGANFHLKGVDRGLLAIAKLVPTERELIRLWIVGEGDITKYQRKAQQLGLADQVEFLGARTDVQQLLFAADLLLHPARREAAGLVLIEAIVCGVPVLATASCGYAIYVEQAKAGEVIAAPFNQDKFNLTLQRVLDAKRLQSWRENALQYAATADWYGREAVALLLEQLVDGQPQVVVPSS